MFINTLIWWRYVIPIDWRETDNSDFTGNQTFLLNLFWLKFIWLLGWFSEVCVKVNWQFGNVCQFGMFFSPVNTFGNMYSINTPSCVQFTSLTLLCAFVQQPHIQLHHRVLGAENGLCWKVKVLSTCLLNVIYFYLLKGVCIFTSNLLWRVDLQSAIACPYSFLY